MHGIPPVSFATQNANTTSPAVRAQPLLLAALTPLLVHAVLGPPPRRARRVWEACLVSEPGWRV